jgi:hypothetical protein
MYWRRECPARGWWWREFKKSNKPSKLPGMYKNSTKTASFPQLLTLKVPKTQFFTYKYLTKYTLKTFFEEYILFKIFIT